MGTQPSSNGKRRSSLMGFIPTVKPARPNGVYLARHSRCHGRGPNRGSPLPLAQPAPLPTVGPEAVAAAGNYGQNLDAIRSVPRKWSATMRLDDALAVTIPQSRSQIQSWDALSDSSLHRHRDWRSNRDGAGSPETLRHPHKHDERVSAWMRASSPVNNELAMIQENRVSEPGNPLPLSMRALTSLLPSSPYAKSMSKPLAAVTPPPRSLASRSRAHRRDLEEKERRGVNQRESQRRNSAFGPGTVSKCDRLGCTRSGWAVVQPAGHEIQPSQPHHAVLWGIGMAGRSGRSSSTDFPMEYTKNIKQIFQGPSLIRQSAASGADYLRR